MRNILLIILISVSTSSFSQVEIDTSEIKSIRYEWKRAHKKKDSTLIQILTEYKSGIYKEQFSDFENLNSKFGYYFIYDKNNSDKKLKAETSNLVFADGNIIHKNYHDKEGNLISIHRVFWENDSLKENVTVSFGEYYKNSKLKKLSERFKNDKHIYYKYFYYDDRGQILKTDYYKDSSLIKISNYKNGLLTEQKFPQIHKLPKKVTYRYNENNRMIRKDEDDIFYYKYKYNSVGIESIEKLQKTNNMIVNLEIFKYNSKGQLTVKKEFKGKKLINEYHYLYK